MGGTGRQPHNHRTRALLSLCILGSNALLLSNCGGVTEPRSDEAEHIATLWWVMFGVSCVVAVVVLVLLAYALVRPRRPSRLESSRSATLFALIGGAIIPGVILLSTFAYSLVVTRQAEKPTTDELVVRITAEQFRYIVTYPAEGVTVEDELHLPAGRDVRLELISRDVIHSFWVPELNGKLDMFPQRQTVMNLHGIQPGQFQARCAEFCGINHATMTMGVVVHSAEDFQAWLVQHSAARPGQ